MGQYMVVVVKTIDAENKITATQEANCSICQDNGGAWFCEEMIPESGPEQ